MLTPMSRNSELILAGYDAWNRDDLDAYLETLHPDVKLHTSGAWPDFDSVYSGHEGIAEFWRRMREAWEMFDIDVEHIDEEGDCFTTAIRFRGKGRRQWDRGENAIRPRPPYTRRPPSRNLLSAHGRGSPPRSSAPGSADRAKPAALGSGYSAVASRA